MAVPPRRPNHCVLCVVAAAAVAVAVLVPDLPDLSGALSAALRRLLRWAVGRAAAAAVACHRRALLLLVRRARPDPAPGHPARHAGSPIGRASCRERVCQYV